MANAVDYIPRTFKALKMATVFEVTNKDGVIRIGMPGDYKIVYGDASEEVMSAKELERYYQVKA
jgi:hypothetical protein